MVESYLHKIAKELLYKEIEEKSGFEWKSHNSSGFESLITRDDYRSECVLMEFPTIDGYYPDEFGCNMIIEPYNCKKCKWNNECGFDHMALKDGSCGGFVGDRWEYSCKKETKGYRFNTGLGYCKCSNCEYFNFKDSVVHDIAAFWKGNVRWAIEIINKHEPSWDKVYASMPYYIYLVKAEDVLKRVQSTPIFVYDIRYTDELCVKPGESDLFD